MILHDNKLPVGNPNWKPGQSGNPRGRPLGARQRISEKLLADLATVWEEQGTAVLQRLATDDPGKLAQIAFGLLPKEAFLSVQQAAPGNLEPDEWATLRRVLDIIQATAPADAPPAQVFETIEHALRAEFAKPIEREPILIEHKQSLAIEPVAILPPPF